VLLSRKALRSMSVACATSGEYATKRQSDLTFYRWAFYCVDVFREQDLFARSLIKVALILHTDLFM